MSKDDKVGLPKTESQLAKEFIDEYKKLCSKTGFQIVVTPQFVSTNHGTFEISQVVSIGRLPKA